MKKTFKVGDKVIFDMFEVKAMDLNITGNRKFTVLAIDDDLLTLDKFAAYNSSGRAVSVIHKDYFKLVKSSLNIFYEEYYQE